MVKVFETFARALKELPCMVERNTHSPNSGHVTIRKAKLAKFGFLCGLFSVTASASALSRCGKIPYEKTYWFLTDSALILNKEPTRMRVLRVL